MRKLGKENWKLFVLLSILTVIIIIIFIFFIRYALSGDNSYHIAGNGTVGKGMDSLSGTTHRLQPDEIHRTD